MFACLSHAPRLGAAIAVISLACPASGPALAQRYQTTLSGGNHVFEPGTITGGQSSKIHVYARCFDTELGRDVSDNVQLLIARGPDRSKFVGTIPALINGGSNPTTWPQAMLQTSETTTPGVFAGSPTTVLSFRGVGTRCGAYAANTSSTGALTVAPTLTVKGKFWWLNGGVKENPDYEFNAMLTASPEGLKYKYELYYGDYDGKYVDISDAHKYGPVIETSFNKVSLAEKVLPWDPKPAAGDFFSFKDYPFDKKDVPVTVTVNGARSAPVYVPFRFPAALELMTIKQLKKQLEHFPADNPLDQDDFLRGYKTTIYYRLVDQVGDVLPEKLWIRENFFDKGLIYRKGVEENDWTIGQTGDQAADKRADPELIKDVITGQLAGKPQARRPQTPLQFEDMGYWRGSITVGSKEKYRGVLVALLNWQKFRDHARHCDVRTPPNETAQYPCPKGAD